MKNLLLTATLAFTLSTPAFAVGTHVGKHDDGHADEHAEMKIGMPGNSARVIRTIDVTMRETDDGRMLFEPASLEIVQGETEHEFVIGTVEDNAEHKKLMAKMDMEHDDPNSVRLDEGGSGEVIWTFSNAGAFEFACLIPGHYETGMHGPIAVGEQFTQAAVEYTIGKVKKIDTNAGKVTIIHGPIVNLDMPAMTMVFRADEAAIARLSEGQDIEFVVERINGKLTITQMK